MFIWKAYQDALPTLSNLFKRNNMENDLCPICKNFSKSVGYVLWSCIASRDAWHQGSKKTQIKAFHNNSFLVIWSRQCNELQQEELEECAIVARMIWEVKNELFMLKNLDTLTPLSTKQGRNGKLIKMFQCKIDLKRIILHRFIKSGGKKKLLTNLTRPTGMLIPLMRRGENWHRCYYSRWKRLDHRISQSCQKSKCQPMYYKIVCCDGCSKILQRDRYSITHIGR